MRINEKFLAAFDQTFAAEESVRAVLQTELFDAYEPVFIANAIAERSAAAKAKTDPKKKPKKGEVEVTKMPVEPTEPKDTKKGQILWDKYAADKPAYELWAMGKARRVDITEGVEITFPEDLEYLRPISDKTGKPLKVIISKVPQDTSKALWSDEIKPVTWQPIDLKVRKDKSVMPKFKGLSDRVTKACEEELLAKLMTLSKSDAAIWEGCAPKKVAKKGDPKEPKAPKDLVNPAEMFKEGKNTGKFEEYDDDGVPKSKASKKGAVELKDKEIVPLRKQWEKAKTTWDKHQEAMTTYNDEMKKLRDLELGEGAEDDFGVPIEQKEGSCKTAAKTLVEKLVEDLIAKRLEELAVAVNKGTHDTAELQEVVVQETQEEVEIITDPVLKAFRRFDPEALNSCSADEFKSFLSALGEDELESGTHKFYSEVSDVEVDWTREKLGQAGVEQGGNISYTDIKNFIEAADVPVVVSAGKAPTNLVSCLLAMKIESRVNGLKNCEVMFSPRTWRSKLGEEFGSPGGASTRSQGGVSPRSGSGRKSAKKKTAAEGELGAEGSPKGDKKEKRKSDRSSTAKKSEKDDEEKAKASSKEDKEEKVKSGEEEPAKKDKDKKEKDDKKEKKEKKTKK